MSENENKNKEKFSVRIIDHLKSLRDDWSDEIPSRILHSTDDDNKYKVRKNWWASLGGSLRMCVKEGVVTDPLIKENIETFLNKPDSEMTTPEDIARANKIINIVLGDEPPEIKNKE